MSRTSLLRCKQVNCEPCTDAILKLGWPRPIHSCRRLCLVSLQPRAQMPVTTSRTTQFVSVCVLSAVLSVATAQESLDSDISIEKTESAQITGLEDWVIVEDANTVLDGARRSANNFLCAHSTTGRYALSLSSSNGSGRFSLESASGENLDYEVIVFSFSETAPPTGPLQRNVITGPATFSNLLASPTVSCLGQGFGLDSNLRFRALIRRANFNAASPGIYRDTFIVTVSPE